ncbi:MAG: LysR family transcriptional regulator [Acidimicrobiales bacterium]
MTGYPDLDSLALFVAVCDTGSISAAGRLRGLTQPAATARIRHLERQLGVELLHRTTTGSSSTDAGTAVATWARQVVASADKLMAGAGTLHPGSPRLALGVTASYTTAEYLLPQALIELRDRSPDIVVRLSVSNSAAATDDVLSGRSQLGFIEGDSIPKGLRYRTVATDRLVVIAAAGNPLARSAPLHAEALVRHTLVLREPGSGTRAVFVRALRAAGVQIPDGVIEIGSTAAIMQAIAAGRALGVVSELALGGTAHRLRVVETDGLQLDRRLLAIWEPHNSRLVSDVVAAAARVGSRFGIGSRE